MGGKVGVWRGVKSDQIQGVRGCRFKGAEEANARGKVETDTWGGGNGCFGRVEMGGKGEKRGKPRCEAGDSPWGVGEVCTEGVKNFSSFVSV